MTRILEGTNKPTPSEAASYVDKFLEHEKEIDTLRSEFMTKCKKVREAQGELLDDAKSKGVPKKVIKTLSAIKVRKQKNEQALADLDDDKTYAVDIMKALGGFADLPLGAAAVERETAPADGKDPIAAAAEQAWDEADPSKKPATAH